MTRAARTSPLPERLHLRAVPARAHVAPASPGAAAAFYRQIAQMCQRYIEEAEARYAPPDFPVRIVWGGDDGWIPLEQGQALADRIANGKLIRVPRAGHLVQEDAPEAIVVAVLDR